MTKPTSTNTDKFLTRRQVAARWEMHPESIKRREASGQLVSYKFGSTVRYKLSDVLAIEAAALTTAKQILRPAHNTVHRGELTCDSLHDSAT